MELYDFYLISINNQWSKRCSCENSNSKSTPVEFYETKNLIYLFLQNRAHDFI